MIKNILGALLLGLLLTACGKTGEETTNPTVQDSTAADAEARRRAEEEAQRKAAEKERKKAQAAAEKRAREQQEKLEQERELERLEQERLREVERRAQEEADRRAAEIEAAKNAEAKAENISQFRKALTDIEVLLKSDISLEKAQELKDSANSILDKIKSLKDEGLLQKANSLIGRLTDAIFSKSPKKGSFKEQALEQLKSDLERANLGQIKYAEILESLESARASKQDLEFQPIILGLEAAKKALEEKAEGDLSKYTQSLIKLAEEKGSFNPNLKSDDMEKVIGPTKKDDKVAKAVNLENFTSLIGADLANKLLPKIDGSRKERESMLENFLKMLFADVLVGRISDGSEARDIASIINAAVNFINNAKFADEVSDGLLEKYKKDILNLLPTKVRDLKLIKDKTGSAANTFLGW